MLKVTLRPLNDYDLPLLLAWAWIPQVWEYSPTWRNSGNLTWEEHNEWFHTKREWRSDWIIEVDDMDTSWATRPVGVVHVTDLNTDHPEIGLYIAEILLWGNRIGRRALELAMEQVKESRLWAVIHPMNKRSIKLFTGLGFNKVGKARKEQDLYELRFNTPGELEVPISQYQERYRRSYQPVPA